MKILSCLPAAAALALLALGPGQTMASPQPLSGDIVKPLAGSQPIQLARRGRGADDGPSHDKNDDHGGRGRHDGKGRGRGSDDGGRRHSLTETAPAKLLLARHGADDRKSDDRGGKSKGRGRGRDDGPRHS